MKSMKELIEKYESENIDEAYSYLKNIYNMDTLGEAGKYIDEVAAKTYSTIGTAIELYQDLYKLLEQLEEYYTSKDVGKIVKYKNKIDAAVPVLNKIMRDVDYSLRSPLMDIKEKKTNRIGWRE